MALFRAYQNRAAKKQGLVLETSEGCAHCVAASICGGFGDAKGEKS